MRRLPPNYTVERYGLFARLVEEGDAEFIIKLRTDPKLSRFLHKTDPDIDGQVRWIREYKKREEEGTEYYFIFYKNEKAIGLYRLYQIDDEKFISGSWIFSSEAPFGAAFLGQIILREIAFLDFGCEYEDNSVNGVHVDNTAVLNFDLKMACMKEIGRYSNDMGDFVALKLTRDDFLRGRKKIMRMLSVNEFYMPND